jgi:Tfp pilus assembly protein PilP
MKRFLAGLVMVSFLAFPAYSPGAERPAPGPKPAPAPKKAAPAKAAPAPGKKGAQGGKEQAPAEFKPLTLRSLPAVPGRTKPEEETYSYESSGRRDPFYSLISAAKLAQKKKKKAGSPLEEYDLSEIKLVAIVADLNKSLSKYALVKLPSGKHYTLREGNIIGVHSGRIVKIKPDAIMVQEVVTDVRGNQSPKIVTLKLREEEE